MYSKTSVGIRKESPSTAPTEPPYPQPPLTPLAFNERTPTFAGVQVNENNQLNNLSKPNSHAPVPWSSGLCGCFDDIGSCSKNEVGIFDLEGCLTCWCPCITFGRIAEILDQGSLPCGVSGALYTLIFCFTGCCCLYSCFYRSKLRGQYFLEESPCADCCVHFCCNECALCQEYRELTHHGFDMSIGWHGNMARQRRLAALEDGNGMTL